MLCIKCHKDLPEERFHLAASGKRHTQCKECRTKYERKRRKKSKDTRLDDIEKGAVDLFCAASRLGGANIPHSSELLETLLTYFGGINGFCNLFMKQYYDSPAGGAFRTKQIDSVMRLIVNNTALGGAKKPLSLWNEEELEEELQKRLLELNTTVTLQVIPQANLPAPRDHEEAPSQDS